MVTVAPPSVPASATSQVHAVFSGVTMTWRTIGRPCTAERWTMSGAADHGRRSHDSGRDGVLAACGVVVGQRGRVRPQGQLGFALSWSMSNGGRGSAKVGCWAWGAKALHRLICAGNDDVCKCHSPRWRRCKCAMHTSSFVVSLLVKT
uniref:Uncharacterized protein n=1 Tax=Arundo donax TaxID=35708 RepID=A0A0A9DGK5_ARUDO